jgi:hypothetical protein
MACSSFAQAGNRRRLGLNEGCISRFVVDGLRLDPLGRFVDAWWFLLARLGCVEAHDTLGVELADGFHLLGGFLPCLVGLGVVTIFNLDGGCISQFVLVRLRFGPLVRLGRQLLPSSCVRSDPFVSSFFAWS